MGVLLQPGIYHPSTEPKQGVACRLSAGVSGGLPLREQGTGFRVPGCLPQVASKAPQTLLSGLLSCPSGFDSPTGSNCTSTRGSCTSSSSNCTSSSSGSRREDRPGLRRGGTALRSLNSCRVPGCHVQRLSCSRKAWEVKLPGGCRTHLLSHWLPGAPAWHMHVSLAEGRASGGASMEAEAQERRITTRCDASGSAQASQTEGSVEGPSAESGGSSSSNQSDSMDGAPAPALGPPEGANQKKPSASEPAKPRRTRGRPSRPESSKGGGAAAWGWVSNLLPDLKAFVFLVFHLSTALLLAKFLGVDVYRALGFASRAQRARVVAPEATAAVASAPAGKSKGMTLGTILVDESMRRPPCIVSNLVVPFSEFLFHVKKDNVQTVTVSGDKVAFVVKRADLIQPQHRASSLLREVQNVERAVSSDSDLRMRVDPAASATAGAMKEREMQQPRPSLTKKKQHQVEPFHFQLQLATVKPADLALPYAELAAKGVEFGAPEKAPFRFVNNVSVALLYAGVLASIISRLTTRNPHRVGGRQSKGKGQGPGVLFADVAGVDEAKEELEEIVEYLRMPEKFTRLGARPPRGVLLVGPPGTGKTMLAKAVAGEADVPFVSCSGSEFVELYVGLGASRVRDLFTQAKKEAPSIVFIDEIDSVAKVRDGRARSVGNDEREQTLNQLLTEMDGFDSNTAVIVLAATNRADVLDPALRRPGRFDRIVAVEPPDRKGRVAILGVHLEKQQLPLADDVNVHSIASATTGFTGADLANVVNEAALLAARDEECEEVSRVHFEKAVERAIAGIEKKRSALGRMEKAVVARHEVGHAILGAAVAKILPHHPLVQKISIIPRSGGALGFAYIPPAPEGDERQLLFVDELRGQLTTLLGGRAAEEVAFQGRVSTGAMDDIRRATDMAYKGVAEYGLSRALGPVSVSTLSAGGVEGSGGYFGLPEQGGSLVELVQKEVQSLLQEALVVARTVIRRNMDILTSLGEQLEEEEALDGECLKLALEAVDETQELRAFLLQASMIGPLTPLPPPQAPPLQPLLPAEKDAAAQ